MYHPLKNCYTRITSPQSTDHKQQVITGQLSMEIHQVVETVSSAKLLGVTLDSHLNVNENVGNMMKTTNQKMHGLLLLKHYRANTEALKLL